MTRECPSHRLLNISPVFHGGRSEMFINFKSLYLLPQSQRCLNWWFPLDVLKRRSVRGEVVWWPYTFALTSVNAKVFFARHLSNFWGSKLASVLCRSISWILKNTFGQIFCGWSWVHDKCLYIPTEYEYQISHCTANVILHCFVTRVKWRPMSAEFELKKQWSILCILYTKKFLQLIVCVFRSKTGALKVLMRSVKNNARCSIRLRVWSSGFALLVLSLFSSITLSPFLTVKHKTWSTKK